MKPLGPIPAGFSATDGELVLGGAKVSDWLEEAGDTPLFLYSRDMIAQRIAAIRTALPERMELNYAVKANPWPPLLEFIEPLVDGFDIASSGEWLLLDEDGIAARRTSFAGPGKRDDELRVAIEAGITLNCESAGEADRALAIGDEIGRAPRMAIRVNPDFELRGSGMKMSGGAKVFGVDADKAAALARRVVDAGVDWQGFHIFAGSQSLDAAAISEAQRNTIELARRLAEEAGITLPKLNLGGGFGIPYFAGDDPLDLYAVGEELGKIAAPDVLPGTRLVLELGRYLVGQAGVYLTRVVDRKMSQGETFLVVDGGLHHQLAASGNFGAVVKRNYPVAVAHRFAAEPEEVVNICGALCTPLDRLATQAHLPRAQVGDTIAIFCAGAYGATASPMHFLGHGPAREMLI
jgi:diaminopimelate decarboxylase